MKKEKGIIQVRHLFAVFGSVCSDCGAFVSSDTGGEIFGSEGDWSSQHVGAAGSDSADYARGRKLFFLSMQGLGGGINAYDLAYYGLLRPDILLAYLLPGVPMGKLISLYLPQASLLR